MSRRGRSRNRGKAQNQGADNAKKSGARQRKNEPKVDPVEFWGDATALPDPIDAIGEVPDVKAVVRSLGRIPLSGQETAAEHWFSLVYERAAVLAGALAAAGELSGESEGDAAR
jgi:hypothetical protein